MLDGVTLDQLRTFIAAVDEGSFSAAARKLRRAQSVVSQTLANLETQLGVKLFDRSARYPRLTDAGRSLLPDARAVADNIDGFKARARAIREGLEPELAVAMDVMYPMDALTRAATHSRKTYPHTPLRLYVEALGAVIKPVLDRNCSIGIIGSLPTVPDELRTEPLLDLPFVTVVSPTHSLAANARRGLRLNRGQTGAVGSHRQNRAHERPGLRGALAADLALGGLGSQARLPESRLGLGTHALAHSASRSRQSNARQDPRRRRAARHGHADEGGLSQGRTAGTGGPRVYYATQAVEFLMA